MLEAEVSDLVAEGDEEVIRAVVTALVERAGFADQAVEFGDVLFREVELFGAVGGHVEVVLRRDLGSERDLAEVAAGEDGRVDELLEADGFEAW